MTNLRPDPFQEELLVIAGFTAMWGLLSNSQCHRKSWNAFKFCDLPLEEQGFLSLCERLSQKPGIDYIFGTFFYGVGTPPIYLFFKKELSSLLRAKLSPFHTGASAYWFWIKQEVPVRY